MHDIESKAAGKLVPCLRSNAVCSDAALAKDVRRIHCDGKRAGRRDRLRPSGLGATEWVPRVLVMRFSAFFWIREQNEQVLGVTVDCDMMALLLT